MRSDLLTMMGTSRGASLDEIILEAQKAEEILYRRNKEQRRAEYLKHVSFQDNTLDNNKHPDGEYNNHFKPNQITKLEESSNGKTVPFQRNRDDKKNRWNNNKPWQNSNLNAQY